MFKKTESWEDEMICPVAKSHSVTELDLHLHPLRLIFFLNIPLARKFLWIFLFKMLWKTPE